MPKKRGSSKRSRNFQAWPVRKQLALSTLATDTVISGELIGLDQEAYIISADLQWSLRGGTAGEGPLQVGVASGDLSVGEIGEAVWATPSRQDDWIEREKARRPVRKVGTFPGLSTDEVLNDGKAIRTKIKIPCTPTGDLDFWCENQSGASLTGGQVIEVTGTVYGYWR